MNTEIWNLFRCDLVSTVSYSQHCISLSNFNSTGNVTRELQSNTDVIIMARIFYSRYVVYDSKRQNNKGLYGQNTQKEEILYFTHRLKFFSRKRTV